jgi:Trypsin-co-occurring domain 2
MDTEVAIVVAMIQDSVSIAESGNLPFFVQEVRLDLQAKVTRDAEGGLKLNLFGLELGANVDLTEVELQQINFKLKPSRVAASGFDHKEAVQSLVDRIREVMAGLGRLQNFVLTETSLSIDFSVTSGGSIAVGAKLGGKILRGQKLTLVLGLKP